MHPPCRHAIDDVSVSLDGIIAGSNADVSRFLHSDPLVGDCR